MSTVELVIDPHWTCVKCKRDFIDPETIEDAIHTVTMGMEPRLYWLGINEPLCSDCAIESGIPPIDKEE